MLAEALRLESWRTNLRNLQCRRQGTEVSFHPCDKRTGGGMVRTIKGPGIFLAQFASDAAPFNNLKDISRWAAGMGYKGVQIPTWDARLFDLKRAAESRDYCDDIAGTLKS